MKLFASILFFSTIYTCCYAQERSKQLPPSGILPPNLIAGGIAFATGSFSSTHFLGFTVEYSRCRYMYGKASAKAPFLLSYTVNAGISHINGRESTISNYSYKYPANTWVYAMGGVMLLPVSSVNISATAGPALMLYNKNTRFALSGKVEVNYFVKKRIAISPFIQFLNEKSTHVLWTTGIKGGFAF